MHNNLHTDLLFERSVEFVFLDVLTQRYDIQTVPNFHARRQL